MSKTVPKPKTSNEIADTIPHAPDSERAIIGALLLDNSLIRVARDRLKPGYFYLRSNRFAFEAALALDARGIATDPVQLGEELRQRGTLDAVGGMAHVALFTDYAVRSDFDGHCERVSETALRRMLWVLTNRSAEAANSAQSMAEILAGLRELVKEAEARLEQARPSNFTLAKDWAAFDAEEFQEGERIAFAVERGEAALVNALPNAGKTTLALNVALALAAGRSLAPVVTEAIERRVLYVDGETRRARLKRDLRTMTAGFSRAETMAVGRNLHLVCEAEIGTESLALTRSDHWPKFGKEAVRVKPDFIVIDTLASLCPVFNENDNSEQQRRIWTPLQKLARDCNAAVLVLHHVGKRNEDSQTPEAVYRGRGASASGGFARAVWLLTPDPVTPGLSTLKCVKAKGQTPPETRLQLDSGSRWFVAMTAIIAKTKTALERVLDFVTTERRLAEIEAALKADFSRRSIERTLAEAIELGKLELVKRGTYKPASASSATSAQDLFAEVAELAERPWNVAESSTTEAENGPQNPFPPLPPHPIGLAETVTVNNSNDLASVPQNGQNEGWRKVRKEKRAAEFSDVPRPNSSRKVGRI